MAINFPEKYREAIIEEFNVASLTENLFTRSLDMEFSGVKTVHVPNLIGVPLQDYNRSAEVGTASRYGKTTEVQDAVQTFEMTQDKSLSLSVDKGNNKEQFDMKKAGDIMKLEKEKFIVPYIDTYRLKHWAEKAGIHYELSGALSKENIAQEIMTAHNQMLEKGVPDQIILVIRRTAYQTLKLAKEWVNATDLAKETLPKGVVKEFDGLQVMPMLDARMPENVEFMLIYKDSLISPMKIQKWQGHVDPPGLSGDLMEFRLIFDAFVIGQKADGCLAAVKKSKVVAVPTFSGNSGSITAASTTGASTFHYTTDGSDPRYSDTVQVGSSISLPTTGMVARAYASKAGMFDSAVADYVRED